MLNNDAWSAVAELAASQHGCFTHQQAANNGIGRRRLDRAIADGLVVREYPRVLRFAGSPPTWRGRLWAAAHSSGGVASHRAAGRLLGHDGFEAAPLEITVARGRLPALPGVILHRWTNPQPDLDHVMVAGIPCTSVAATLSQLGMVLPRSEVERTLDEALRRGTSLRWVQQTVERLHRPGPSGTGTLIKLLADERRSGRLPDSWFERLVQRIVLSADIPRPELQHEVRVGPAARYRLDMAWPELAVGLEWPVPLRAAQGGGRSPSRPRTGGRRLGGAVHDLGAPPAPGDVRSVAGQDAGHSFPPALQPHRATGSLIRSVRNQPPTTPNHRIGRFCARRARAESARSGLVGYPAANWPGGMVER